MEKGKERQVAVKKAEEPTKKASAAAAVRGLSPLRSWEHEIERMFEEFPFFRLSRFRDFAPFRFPRDLRLRV